MKTEFQALTDLIFSAKALKAAIEEQKPEKAALAARTRLKIAIEENKRLIFGNPGPTLEGWKSWRRKKDLILYGDD